MKRFLAIFTGSEAAMQRSGWPALDPAARAARQAEGMRAWAAWASRNAAAIVDQGTPLGRTKRVGPGGIEDIRNAMAVWVVVEAESHEAAARLFEDHPHFTVLPGEAIEVMECLPVPGR
jgi:hypothetical protein